MRLLQRFSEIFVVLALFRSPEPFDGCELIFSEIEIALDDLCLAKIFTHLRVVRIERDGLQVISDPFVGATELTLRITATIERARGVRVLQCVEDVESLLVALRLRERIGIFGEFGVRENAAVSLKALVLLPVPDLSRGARCKVLLLNIRVTPDSSASASSRSGRAARASTGSRASAPSRSAPAACAVTSSRSSPAARASPGSAAGTSPASSTARAAPSAHSLRGEA